ncbi:putative hemolysin [Arcanobacterium pluranimalium]|uniref:CNNM domain-containing protein n=1 Tax=Arcanobacterium pluranimalium TaxID=108028 RepID=UPI001958F2E1|nr:putative hemolysin [Arcanobacterium pluranimalium]
MSPLLTNILFVLLFTLIGAFFAASEMALVSLRDTQIESMAFRSRSGKKIQELTADSNRFLSAVQVGVTLAGFFSASFGAAEIAPLMVPWLENYMGSSAAINTAFIVTTVFISYLSIVFGELVPKRLAMQSAETFALVVAYPLSIITALLRPVIWFLGLSTNIVLRILGRDPNEKREEMDAEELRTYVAGYEAIPETERSMVVDLLSVGTRSVEEVMTPRTEVDFLDASTPLTEVRAKVNELEHSRYPVRDNSNDDEVIGFIHIRDLIAPDPKLKTVRDIVRPVIFFPEGKPVLAALTEMRNQNAHLAIIVDEYGGTDGLVTIEDVVEEFVGEIQDEYDADAPAMVEITAGGEVSGLLGRAEVSKYINLELPDGPFDTLGGFIVNELGRMPEVGDQVELDGVRFTVRAMDQRRIDRVYAEIIKDDPATQAES